MSSFSRPICIIPETEELLKWTEGSMDVGFFRIEEQVENVSVFPPWPMNDTLEDCKCFELSDGNCRSIGSFGDIVVGC